MKILLALAAAALLLLTHMILLARADPVIRHARFDLPGLETNGRPIRILLLTDIHVSGPDMPPERVERIVATANSLSPDLILLGGDFVSAVKFPSIRHSIQASIAPLRGFNAPLGAIAVIGNHDHWRDAAAVRRALDHAGVTVLDNQAIRRGPLAIGGIDDAFTGNADLAGTVRAMVALGGTPILLSHSPDPFADAPPEAGLVLAGHTHCGQVRLPGFGPILTASKHGERYACGIVEEDGRRMVVSGGLGTSILPLRLGAPPEIWIIDVD